MGLGRRLLSDRRLGFVWLVFWLAMYDRPERHPRVSPAELAHIRSDPPDPPGSISWLSLLRYRQTWAYTLGMFLTGPIWWFYLYWMPKFLKNNHGIDLEQVFWPLLVVYLMADVGSIGGGGLSSWLIRRGATVNVARKTAFLRLRLCAVPVVFVARVTNMWMAVSGRPGRRRPCRFLGQPLHDRLRHGAAQGGQLRSSASAARPAAWACSVFPR